MLTPEEFVEKWGAEEDCPLRRVSPSVLATVEIPAKAKRFLLSAGLPDGCTNLSFSLGGNQPMPRLADKYLAIGYLQSQLPEDGGWYWCIGRSGAGNPVCIDGRDGAVVYLNHDNRFERILINSSVPQLAESILVYSEFYGPWSDLLYFGDDDDEEEDSIERRLAEMRRQIEKELRRIDAPALGSGTYWAGELSRLDYELKGES